MTLFNTAPAAVKLFEYKTHYRSIWPSSDSFLTKSKQE